MAGYAGATFQIKVFFVDFPLLFFTCMCRSLVSQIFHLYMAFDLLSYYTLISVPLFFPFASDRGDCVLEFHYITLTDE